ncbi:hypothetical protein [Rhodococcus jostii]|uniref:hypothetical protein n=1 Tax=Rhodococcus jostii TaxID=132919 RepID=UPI003643E7B7
MRSDRRIGYDAVYGPNDNDDGSGGQVPGLLSIEDLTDSLADGSTGCGSGSRFCCRI